MHTSMLIGFLLGAAPVFARPYHGRHLVNSNFRRDTNSTGKRGVAYNDASLADAFSGSSQVSWAYNWAQTSDGLTAPFEYVPMLWGDSSDFTGTWSDNAQAAISAGSTHLLSFNEPDLAEQSNMSPEQAAASFATYMSPFADQASLGTPAVTNGADPMGLGWLSSFMGACTDCPLSFAAIHWYDSAFNAQYFKDHVTEAHETTGLPIWVTEFGCTDGSDEDKSAFLEDVMGWMDEQDFVERYSYFMASEGLLISGGALSSYGHTFAGI